ncbi:MAG: OmpA family protein [Gammaproteobacteria bacterium]|nr:OmpA family protein [Gammaproteobacteria bacterium]
MNIFTQQRRPLTALALALWLGGCAMPPPAPEGPTAARQTLSQLQADNALASRVPMAMAAAERAVVAAEQPQTDPALAEHLTYMADHKVAIASAFGQARLLEDQRKALSQESDSMRLDARTAEADQAHDNARAATDAAEQQSADLQQQIDELNARETERGLVVTLGDLLFDTGKSALRGGATSHLLKLAAFLNQYPQRTVMIEGHTDSVGSESSNISLSQRRAEAVRDFLISQGIAANRVVATGKGESWPVAGNDTSSGRQQNRRVEVVIVNAPQTAAR